MTNGRAQSCDPDYAEPKTGLTRAVVPLLSRPSVRGVPQLHGSMTLVERRRTIYFRAENSNVAEQERYKGLRICSSRSDSAAHHEKSRCASSQHQLRSPALSVPVMSRMCPRRRRAQKSTCGGDQPHHQLRAERRHVQLVRSSCSASVVVRLSLDRLGRRQSVRSRRMQCSGCACRRR